MNTSVDNACIQTTIPYDKGWNVFVDGVKVDTYKTFDALVAFDINTQGDHTVKLVYAPTIVIIGGCVSIASIALFATILIMDYKKRKSQSKRISVEVK